MKIKFSRPTLAGALAASLLSVGLVGTSVPAAFADGVNAVVTVSHDMLDPVNAASAPVDFSGTATSDVRQIVVRVDNESDTFEPEPLAQFLTPDPASVAQQDWTQSVDFTALIAQDKLADGAVSVAVEFYGADSLLIGDPEIFPFYVDVHAPKITATPVSGSVPGGSLVTVSTDADLFGPLPVATYTAGLAAAVVDPPTAGSDALGDSHTFTVNSDMQIKVLAVDAAGNQAREAFTYTAEAALATTTTLSVSPASPQVQGTALTLTASVSASGIGTFEYFDGATSLGTGTSKTVTPAVGDHSYTAKFTPTNPAAFNSSTSVVHSVTITAKPIVVPPVVTPPVVKPPVVTPPIVLPPVGKPVVKVAKLSVMRVSAAGNEFVKVKNTGQVSVNLRGYQLRDRSGHVLTLPSYTLKAGSSVKVFTGTGKAAAGKLFLKKTTNVWSTRDTASLFNTKGLKVASLRY